MTRAGYVFEGLSTPRVGYENASALLEKCAQQFKYKQDTRSIGMNENDALWRLAHHPETRNVNDTYFYPIHNKNGVPGMTFNEEEYAACFKTNR